MLPEHRPDESRTAEWGVLAIVGPATRPASMKWTRGCLQEARSRFDGARAGLYEAARTCRDTCARARWCGRRVLRAHEAERAP